MIQDVYEPLSRYRDEFEQKFFRLAAEKFEELSQASGVDIEANRRLVAEIKELESQAEESINRRTNLGCFFVLLMSAGIVAFIADYSRMGDTAWLIPLGCVCIMASLFLLAPLQRASQLYKDLKEKIGIKREIAKKSKEKDAIIASKKNDLKKATKSFIVANKYYDSLNKVHTLLSASIKEIETDLTAGSYDSKTAKKIMDKYNSILSKVLVAEDVDSLNSIMNTITKTQAIVSSYKTNIASKKKAILESKTMNSDKKEINTAQSVIEKKNVMNSDGWKDNKTLLAKQHRYDSIEEMSAELLKIAGV